MQATASQSGAHQAPAPSKHRAASGRWIAPSKVSAAVAVSGSCRQGRRWMMDGWMGLHAQGLPIAFGGLGSGHDGDEYNNTSQQPAPSLVAFAASPPPGLRFLFRSAIQSSDQGRAQAASAPSCQWVVDGLPAPKQPKQPSREILDHSRRFIPNPVRPFPSQDSSRAIPNTSTLHHSFLSLRVRAWHTAAQLPTAKRQGHENHTRPPILLATLSPHTHIYYHLHSPTARAKSNTPGQQLQKRKEKKSHTT
ncbi:hypothetical protein GGP41_004884, partial [Bipolaris sorokiniana]